MRLIKFRVWDKEANLMMVGGIHDGIVIDLRGNVFHVDYDDGKFIPENVVLMAFTGLLDKNGVQMFESDIIETNDVYGKYIGYIVWWEDRWALTYLGQDKVTPQFQSLMTVRNPIIVGNVFESPELINNEEERIKK